jgi:hypothetical protein
MNKLKLPALILAGFLFIGGLSQLLYVNDDSPILQPPTWCGCGCNESCPTLCPRTDGMLTGAGEKGSKKCDKK